MAHAVGRTNDILRGCALARWPDRRQVRV